LIAAHMMSTPPLPRSLVPTIPEALEQVILHALAKKVEERPQSMAQLKSELDQAVGGRSTGERPVAAHDNIGSYATMAAIGPPSSPGLGFPPPTTRPPSTTLSRAAGEVAQAVPPARSRAPLYGALGAGVLAVAAGGFFLARWEA